MLVHEKTVEVVIAIYYKKTEPIGIVTNYGQSLEEMLEKGEYFGYIIPHKKDENFLPYKRRYSDENEPEQMSAVLFQFFNGLTPYEDIIEVMNSGGYTPANLAELLAYGLIYPKEQQAETVIALGSISKESHVASLKTVSDGKEEKKWIDLNPIWDNPFKRGFDEFWSFLAVRKKE
jgi:hypothetical protein